MVAKTAGLDKVIPPEFIDDLLARTDIVEIIESRVSIKKTGRNYSGLCPFHQEKTPSFSVSQDKQFYYCFGCQATGSALKFLMEFDRMDFISAVEYLAHRCGVEVPRDDRVDNTGAKKRNSVYNVLHQSASFFREQLRRSDARDRAISYLKGRGLSGEIAAAYGIGYAPPGWVNLMEKLAISAADRQLLIDAGMLTDNPDESKTYDRFRDRIMFPIRDLRGRTIAFGGRVLDDETKPKYLNSPETAVFHKSRELYGLYEARRRQKNLDQLIVVEGYMDVVALAQHDINYVVATLGTSTTTDHVERMFRIVKTLVFCFDGDSAGRNAAWKALRSAIPAIQDGYTVKFLFLPDGEDPDTYVRQIGKIEFELKVDQAIGFSRFLFQNLELELDIDANSIEGKAALSKLAVPLISELPQGVFKQLIIQELSERTGLETEKFITSAGLDRSSVADQTFEVELSRANSQRQLRLSKLAEYSLHLLIREPIIATFVSPNVLSKLDGLPESQILVELVRWVQHVGDTSTTLLLSQYQDSSYFDYLKKLAEQDPMLERDQLGEEFLGALDKILAEADSQQKQKVIDELVTKPLSELTASERHMLQNHRKS